MKKTASVNAKHIFKKIKQQALLQDVTIQLYPGQLLGLIGPSGAGKTTLIKSIMGMTAINSGQIQLLGHSMPNRAVLDQIGYMAQSDALYNNLTGLENMLFLATYYCLTGNS